MAAEAVDEDDEPLAIRRACMLMVLRGLPLLTSADSDDAKNRWRILEERTRDKVKPPGAYYNDRVEVGEEVF